MAAVVLIFLTLVTIQYVQSGEQVVADATINHTKLNQPGPISQLSTEEQAIEIPGTDGGKIVFLKEDLREGEEEEGSIELTSNSTTELSDDEQFVNELTRSETLHSKDGTDKYLIIAGTYTDDMILLSKQAQYMNKGFDAEIIQFENSNEKNICIGRYTDESSATTLADQVETEHDISTYVFHQPASK